MFCPKCGAEYIAGITICSDCQEPLIAEATRKAKRERINFVTIYETGDQNLILFIKSVFESENIIYYLKNEAVQDLFGSGRLGTGYNILTGPVEIQVDERDAEKAREILVQIEKGEFTIIEETPEQKGLDDYE